MTRKLLGLIAVAMVVLGVVGANVWSDDSAVLPPQAAAPAQVKIKIASNQTAPDVCTIDRTMSFRENEHREPNEMEGNQIKYGCLQATWHWGFDHFTR